MRKHTQIYTDTDYQTTLLGTPDWHSRYGVSFDAPQNSTTAPQASWMYLRSLIRRERSEVQLVFEFFNSSTHPCKAAIKMKQKSVGRTSVGFQESQMSEVLFTTNSNLKNKRTRYQATGTGRLLPRSRRYGDNCRTLRMFVPAKKEGMANAHDCTRLHTFCTYSAHD